MSKICPKCYGRIQKDSTRCLKCGFNMEDLKKASNKEAIKQKREGNSDLVLKSNVLPSDVSKKKLLLFCGFLGLFGVHNFYVGNTYKAFFNVVTTIFGIVFMVFAGLKIYATNAVLNYIEYFCGLFFVLNIIWVVTDFFNIIFNRFKVPVYIEEE